MFIPSEVQHLGHWLEGNGVDVEGLIADAESRLSNKRRELYGEIADRYRRTIVRGVFLAEWAKKYREASLFEVQGTEDYFLFQLAVLDANEGAFKKHRKRFLRFNDGESPLGSRSSFNANSFSDFVTEESATLSESFLKSFDSTRGDARYVALKYLQLLSMSKFVRRMSREARSDPRSYLSYLETSKRLSERTRLAFKLAYLPLALKPEEVEVLEDRYGWPRHATRQVNRIKDVAQGLGFSSAAALSRKLYRVREWANRSAQGGANGAPR